MSCVAARLCNEHLARLANAEDDCTGRFWEGRFKSQALLDEAGLLTAMAYVDLNPIRAGIAKTPEDSQFTSIYQRIQQLKPTQEKSSQQDASTHRFVLLRRFEESGDRKKVGIPYTSTDYLRLVDWTGRCIRAGQRGFIASSEPPILNRLGIDGEAWTEVMSRRGSILGRAMGRLDLLRLHAATLGQEWLRGMRRSHRLLG